MEFFVYSRAAIERVPAHDVPHVVISITSARRDQARIPPSIHCLGILRLTFPDLEEPTPRYLEGDLFSPAHADQVWDFVLLHRDHISRLVVHCDAGVSRSPAVAAAVAKVLGADDSELLTRYRPNALVYRTLLDRYRERFEAGAGEGGS